MLELRHCSIAEIEAASNLAEVLAEYAAESHLPEIGAPDPQWATYRALEAAGVFHPIAAFEGKRLAGCIFAIIAPLPHYGIRVATVESFFVPKSDRDKNVGLRLLAFVEDWARSLGAAAIMLTAPTEGALARVMGAMPKYRHSNQVFVKALA